MKHCTKMKGVLALLAIGTLLTAATSSFAIPFSTTSTYGGTNGQQLSFGNNSDRFYPTVFNQTINFTPYLQSFNSANLGITYSDVSTTGELYAAYVSNAGGNPTPANVLDYVSLGALTGYNDTLQHTQTFNLASLEPAVPASGLASWTLYVAFRESTPGNDSMTLWNIRTYGDYNGHVDPVFKPLSAPGSVVPEPSTVALLGMGLAGIGLAGWRRKKA